jgi:hypothetical protein
MSGSLFESIERIVRSTVGAPQDSMKGSVFGERVVRYSKMSVGLNAAGGGSL